MFNFTVNSIARPSQSEILIEIERLVSYCIKHSDSLAAGPLNDNNLPKPFGPEFYQGFCAAWPKYFSVFSPRHDYSELVWAFWRGCDDFTTRVFAQYPTPTRDHFRYLTVEQVLSIATMTALHALKDSDLKRKHSDRRYEVKDRHSKLNAYVRKLIIRYPKLLVVRVDYAYKDESQYLIGIDDVYRHLRSLNRRKEGNELFNHLVGSAWAIEQGQNKGYHIHAVYFFNGNRCQRDMYYAKELGKLWEAATHQLGYHYNCNVKKADFEANGMRGIGMIHRHDSLACENAIKAVGYLAQPEKEFQHLRMKPNGARIFATGLFSRYRPKRKFY